MTNTITHTISIATTTAASFDWHTLIGPFLSFIAALIAVGAVVWSQWQFDKRQAKDHLQAITLKEIDHKKESEMKSIDLMIGKKELLLNKISELIDLIIQSTQDIHKIQQSEIYLNEFNVLVFSSIKKRHEASNLCRLYFIHLYDEFAHIEIAAESYIKLASQVITSKHIDHADLVKHQSLAQDILKRVISFSKKLISDDPKSINKYR